MRWRSLRRVLLIDDHPVTRRGLRRLIEHAPEFSACIEAASPAEALALAAFETPHLIVSELSFSHCDGFVGLVALRAHYPALPLVVFSAPEEQHYAGELFALGAAAYVSKTVAASYLLQAIYDVLEPEGWVNSLTARGAGAAAAMRSLVRRH